MQGPKDTELLSPEELNALLPLKEKWEKELAALEQQLGPLLERKQTLARKLAVFKEVLPSSLDGISEAGTEVTRDPGLGPSSSPRKRRRFTPVAVYWLPILQALVECGGRARREEVVELVGRKMQDVLTSDDRELLPSGIEVRWKNRVAWQRENMKRRGLLRDDSPQGIWEITDAGRKWLLDLLGRFSFYRLAALRIGNLPGGRPRPVTMGGYRNFVRHFARGFGNPALGEADDETLIDPMVLLWKEGCMELKKYDPAKNAWWDFSELQDARALVGRGEWTIKLTPEGRALLVKMEDDAKLMNNRTADFQPIAIRGENLSATILRDRR